MLRNLSTTLLLTILSAFSFSQEVPYFNNVYQHQNNFANGMTILETDNGYVGYGGTESPDNIGQMILFYKINKSGEEIIWKPYGENNHTYYYGNVGGAMIKTLDGNFAMACHNDSPNGLVYSSLFYLNEYLDTIWQKQYNFQTYTITVNCIQTEDKGFVLTGYVWEDGPDTDILIIKTDSTGEYEWHKIYDDILVEQGTNTIELSNGGFLIGGMRWEAGEYHSLDAMVIKTDSLGNEQWTKYFGNPGVDDDMAFVALADDGNYLVATVYGDSIMSSMYREGRIWIIKINTNGNIINNKKFGTSIISNQIKNMRKLNNGGYLSTGFKFSYVDNYFKGWMLKFSDNLDSIWMREYHYYDGFEETNFFYDAFPTTDKGYIAIGKARPDMGNSKMWVVKVDSMGCDTPGCATGTFVKEFSPSGGGWGEELIIWPNPAREEFKIKPYAPPLVPTKGGSPARIVVYNSQGIKVKEIPVPEGKETVTVNVQGWQKGIYFIQLVIEGKPIITKKEIVY